MQNQQNQIEIVIPVGGNQQDQNTPLTTNVNEPIEPPRNQVLERSPTSIPLSNSPLALLAQNNVMRLIEDYQAGERNRENYYLGNALEILRPFQDNFFYTLVGAAESLVDVHEQIGHRIGCVGNKLKFLYSLVASQLLFIPCISQMVYCNTELKPEKEICDGINVLVPFASYVVLMAFAHVAKNYSNFNAIRESERVERREDTTTNLIAEFVNVVPGRVNEGVALQAVQVDTQISQREGGGNLRPDTTRVSLDTALRINQEQNQVIDPFSSSRARSL
jgi:hypothetical protein